MIREKNFLKKNRSVSGALTVTAAVLIGLFFCIAGRSDVILFGDELHSILTIGKPYSEIIRTYDIVGSGVPLPLIQRFAVQVFGPGPWAYRFPAFLGAIATLLILYPAGVHLIGARPAIIATLGVSLNSMHIFYSRFGRAYSLMNFLAVLMVYAYKRAISQESPRTLWLIILALSAGLLPYVHLTAVGFVIAVGISAVITMVLGKKLRTHGPRLISSFIVGALICVCLYVPVWDSLWQFIHEKAGQGDLFQFNILDILTLLAGNRPAAYVWLVGIPSAAIWIILKKRSQAIVLVVAVVAPVAATFLTRPYGGVYAYAYARYTLIAVPFMLMLLSWLLIELIRKLPFPEQGKGYISLGVGIALLAVSFLTGPLGMKHVDDGPFANSYLSMMPLPAFDLPWDKTPPFYKSLASSAESFQIIETPPFLGYSVSLYRNYYLQHRKKVVIGFFVPKQVEIISGPYVNLADLQSVKDSNSDFLILHLDVASEVEEYLDFVYDGVWPAIRDMKLDPLMFRIKEDLTAFGNSTFIVEYLENQLGAPMYRDKYIVVWDLRDHFKDIGS